MELALREDGSAHVMHSHSGQQTSENGLAMTVPRPRVGPSSPAWLLLCSAWLEFWRLTQNS